MVVDISNAECMVVYISNFEICRFDPQKLPWSNSESHLTEIVVMKCEIMAEPRFRMDSSSLSCSLCLSRPFVLITNYILQVDTSFLMIVFSSIPEN